MKLRIAILGMLLALCVAPAFGDSLNFRNQGFISGTASNSGISLNSVLTRVTLDGTVLLSGPSGVVGFDTGSFTGSLMSGGTFTGGTFDISINSLGTILFASNFSGTLTKLHDDMYKLVGTFTTIVDGLLVKGFTTQSFELEKEDGRVTFEDVHGRTCVSPATAVPEPGTLTLLGTGLLGLGGMVRRKFAISK